MEPSTSVTIEGRSYTLTGNVFALADAESFFNSQGMQLDLFGLFLAEYNTERVISATRDLFPCMMHPHHPDIDFAAAQALINRTYAAGDPVIFEAVLKLCRAAHVDQDHDRELVFDLEGLADANDHFEGKSGISWICFVDGLTPLDKASRVFPCALHRSRPELTLDQARAMMNWKSVAYTIACMQELEKASSHEAMQKFAARLWATANDAERERFTFQVIAKEMAPGAAQA